ncbi:hypothetical protein G7046_g4050 [Stylonectria norvegica]|nr:hypothetical protein G7046_g4050 [Stylonectria norvegica]
MKVTLELRDKPTSQIYTSLDVIRGHLSVNVRNTISVGRICVSLQGIRRSLLSTGGKVYSGRGDDETIYQRKARWTGDVSLQKDSTDMSSQVFDLSRVLLPHFPKPSESGQYTLGKGLHEFPFTFDFPLLSGFMDLSSSNLNDKVVSKEASPTRPKEAAERKNEDRLVFLVQATVTECGIFKRKICRSLELRFLALDSPTLVTNYGVVSRKASRFVPCCQPEPYEAFPQLQNDGCLPLYNASMMLEATISGNGSFYTGDEIPLQISISVPQSMSNQLPICLKSLQLILHQAISAKSKDSLTTTISDSLIREIRPNLILEPKPGSETVELDSSLWRHCRIPTMAPSARMSEVRSDYLLQIRVGFACNNSHKETYATLLIPVAIHPDNELP